MSLRAVAVYDRTAARPRVVPRDIRSEAVIAPERGRVKPHRIAADRRASARPSRRVPLWLRLGDDGQLVGLKLLVLGLLVLLVMVFEVPW